MYPGFGLAILKGGSSNWIIFISFLTRCLSKDAMAVSLLSSGAAEDRTDQLCEIASILHSVFSFDPKGVPSSNQARLYHSPSQADVSILDCSLARSEETRLNS